MDLFCWISFLSLHHSITGRLFLAKLFLSFMIRARARRVLSFSLSLDYLVLLLAFTPVLYAAASDLLLCSRRLRNQFILSRTGIEIILPPCSLARSPENQSTSPLLPSPNCPKSNLRALSVKQGHLLWFECAHIFSSRLPFDLRDLFSWISFYLLSFPLFILVRWISFLLYVIRLAFEQVLCKMNPSPGKLGRV